MRTDGPRSDAGKQPRARRRTAAALSLVVASLVAPLATPFVVPARADEADDAAQKAATGDCAAVVASLADGYAKGTLSPWAARLYQDLRLEAGERAALLEVAKGWSEPRTALLAYLAARLAERKDAEGALARVSSTAPEPSAFLLDAAWAALAADHVPQAASLVVRLRKCAADREETALLEARVAQAQGDGPVAERALASFCASHADADEARRLWSETLGAMHRRADAVAVVEEGLHRARTPALLVARASAALALSDAETARKCLEEWKGRGRPSLRAEALSLKCHLLLFARDVKGADAAADEALKASPPSVHALRAKARCLELLYKPVDAQARLDQAIELRPTWARLYADKGALLARNKKAKEAKRALLEAKRRDPDSLDATLWLGVLEEEGADWSTAERVYRSVLKADPDRADAHRMLAGVVFFLGRLEQCETEASWLLERDPKDAAAWFLRGRVAYKQDRLDDALAAFAKSIEADPTYAQSLMGKGWVLERQEKPEEAKKAYEAGIAADPTLPLVHRYLAELLEDLNDPKGAHDHYARYLELGGADPDEDVKHSVERLSK